MYCNNTLFTHTASLWEPLPPCRACLPIALLASILAHWPLPALFSTSPTSTLSIIISAQCSTYCHEAMFVPSTELLCFLLFANCALVKPDNIFDRNLIRVAAPHHATVRLKECPDRNHPPFQRPLLHPSRSPTALNPNRLFHLSQRLHQDPFPLAHF